MKSANILPDMRQSLEQDLSSLLGFDDGVAGILEHLLDMKKKCDVLEYLTQLLGDNSLKVSQYAERVWRSSQEGNDTGPLVCSSSSKPPSTGMDTQIKTRRDIPKDYMPSTAEQNHARSIRGQTGLGKKSSFSEMKQKHDLQHQKLREQRQIEQQEMKVMHQISLDKLKDKHKLCTDYETPVHKREPGFICGCYGTQHRPLINCLNCGRIVCEVEGYNDCAFCGSAIIKAGNLSEEICQDAAWKHKELMVQFDREFARRTIVHDEQADYFSNTTSSWLTGKERDEEMKKDEAKRRELHHRDIILKLKL